MKNENGFTIINIAFLVPIFLSFGMLIFGSYALISKYTDIQKECRTHVLRAQKVLGQKLKELIDLNPYAKKLRTEEKILRTALLAARGVPVLGAALQVKLNINLTEQAILRGKQESLITSGKISARQIMSKLPSKINGRYSSVGLKVYKTPVLAIAPDHHTMPFFTEIQTVKVDWKLPINHFVPEIILNTFDSINYPKTVVGECAATLVKKGDSWNPKLHLAKF